MNRRRVAGLEDASLSTPAAPPWRSRPAGPARAAVARWSSGLDCSSIRPSSACTPSTTRRCSSGVSSPCTTVRHAGAQRVSISSRKMPSASSTFSASSARNSSVVSDSVIAGSSAVAVRRIGCPSSTSSKPSAAGAVSSSRTPRPRCIATRPSSRNCSESAGWPSLVRACGPPRGAPGGPGWRRGTARRPRRSRTAACGAGDRRARPPAAAPATAACRRSAGMRFAASAHDAASNTYQSRTSRCASTCSRSSASDHSLRASTSMDGGGRHSPGSRRAAAARACPRRRAARVRKMHVALAHALVQRHVLDQQHHAACGRRPRAGCRGTRRRAIARARRRIVERMAHRGDVARRVDQAEQREDAVRRRARASRSSAARQQAVLVEPAGDEQVVVQRQRVERAAGLG